MSTVQEQSFIASTEAQTGVAIADSSSSVAGTSTKNSSPSKKRKASRSSRQGSRKATKSQKGIRKGSGSSRNKKPKYHNEQTQNEEEALELPDVDISDDEEYVDDEKDEGISLDSKESTDKFVGDYESEEDKPSKEELERQVQEEVEILEKRTNSKLDDEQRDLVRADKKLQYDSEYKVGDPEDSEEEEEEDEEAGSSSSKKKVQTSPKTGVEADPEDELEEEEGGEEEEEADVDGEDGDDEEEAAEEKKAATKKKQKEELYQDDFEIAKEGSISDSPIQTRSQRRQKELLIREAQNSQQKPQEVNAQDALPSATSSKVGNQEKKDGENKQSQAEGGVSDIEDADYQPEDEVECEEEDQE